MNIFQVRTFNGKNWNVVRSYAIESEALDFASALEGEWDIKEVSLELVNLMVGA